MIFMHEFPVLAKIFSINFREEAAGVFVSCRFQYFDLSEIGGRDLQGRSYSASGFGRCR
jgi:hypothetical protein